MLRWYKDSLGKDTGGYGHLRLKEDPLSFDQKIASDWLEKDITKARTAATIQFESLPYQTQDLYDVLVSVNFQLGTGWYKKFPKTWKLMTSGAYREAAIEAQDSDWYKQTPVRVKDLQKALQDAALWAKQYADLGL